MLRSQYNRGSAEGATHRDELLLRAGWNVPGTRAGRNGRNMTEEWHCSVGDGERAMNELLKAETRPRLARPLPAPGCLAATTEGGQHIGEASCAGSTVHLDGLCDRMSSRRPAECSAGFRHDGIMATGIAAGKGAKEQRSRSGNSKDDPSQDTSATGPESERLGLCEVRRSASKRSPEGGGLRRELERLAELPNESDGEHSESRNGGEIFDDRMAERGTAALKSIAPWPPEKT